MMRLMTSAFALALLAGAPAFAATTGTTQGTTAPSSTHTTTHAATQPRASSGSSMPNNGLTEKDARQDIQNDGYTHVQDLQRQKNDWVASAMEGKNKVKLQVDELGNVRKE